MRETHDGVLEELETNEKTSRKPSKATKERPFSGKQAVNAIAVVRLVSHKDQKENRLEV